MSFDAEIKLDPDLDKLRPYISALDKKSPTQKHLELSKHLEYTVNTLNPKETTAERQTRETVLISLSKLILTWVTTVFKRKAIPNKPSAELFVSGSYRQNVNSRHDDVDTICCVPKFITRDDFFSEFVALLKKQPGVTHVMAITSAVVPIVEVVWSGIDLDVLMARLERTTVPKLAQILDDNILIGLDDQTVRSINGPRVTELIIKLVPDYPTFALVLRAVRYWAKQRGIYSNKLGYLGGVNWGILVAFCCQLYPTASASKLLHRFFSLYCEWKWPTEIRLVHPYEPAAQEKLGFKQWDPNADRAESFHTMPIITPAYPNQNSSFNVSAASLDIMLDEFLRAKVICDKVMKTQADDLLQGAESQKLWDSLFEHSEFFVRYGSFIEIEARVMEREDEAEGQDENKLNRWVGLVESRLRKLVESLQKFPLRKIYVFPQKFEMEAGVLRWYVGILRHPNKLVTRKRLDFSYEAKAWIDSLYVFKEYEKETHGIKVVTKKWSELEDNELIFPEGKEKYIEKRRVWMNRLRAEQDAIRQHHNPNHEIPRLVYPEYFKEEIERLYSKEDEVKANEEKDAADSKEPSTETGPDEDEAEEDDEKEQQEANKLLKKRLQEETNAANAKRLKDETPFTWTDIPKMTGMDLTKFSTLIRRSQRQS